MSDVSGASKERVAELIEMFSRHLDARSYRMLVGTQDARDVLAILRAYSADEPCVLRGGVIYCQCGNPSAHYGTMGERGAREVRCEPQPTQPPGTEPADAERYRWLRRRIPSTILARIKGVDRFDLTDSRPETLDIAIDEQLLRSTSTKCAATFVGQEDTYVCQLPAGHEHSHLDGDVAWQEPASSEGEGHDD